MLNIKMDCMAAQMDSQIEGAQHAYEAAMQEGQEPAFPVECSWPDLPGQAPRGVQTGNSRGWATGLTIRDRFAIAALQSGDASNWRDSDYIPVNGLSIMDNTARCAYQYADAMLKARATT